MYPSIEKLTTGVTIFEGVNCETNKDDCDPDPCLNSGQCIDLTNDYKCPCNPGFKGKNCESCTDGRLSCKSESNEMNCVLHDDYCKLNTIECTNSLDFVCPSQNYCADDQFTCLDDKSKRLLSCISKDNYCIGKETCPNGNDFLCPPQGQGRPSYCNSSEKFACINEYNVFLNVCIPKEKKCDGNSECPNGKDEEGCVDTGYPWWIFLIIALVVLIVVLITVYCICKRKRKRDKFYPNQEKNTQTEIEAPTIITQTEVETPTMTSKDKAREILFKPDKQIGAIPEVHEDKVGD